MSTQTEAGVLSLDGGPYDACIEACLACAIACDTCAGACLSESRVAHMAACIRSDIDCAEVCRLAAGMMARRSDHALVVSKLCAAICHACAAECRQHPEDHCQACAEACEACEAQCLQLIQ
jgi:hypothetical protein